MLNSTPTYDMFSTRVILFFAILALFPNQGNSQENQLIALNHDVSSIHVPIPLEVEKDSTKKKKRKRKELSEEQKEKVRKGVLTAHVFWTVVGAISFFTLLYYYHRTEQKAGCYGAVMRSLFLLFIYLYGISFGVLLLTLILHLITRHIQKKNS